MSCLETGDPRLKTFPALPGHLHLIDSHEDPLAVNCAGPVDEQNPIQMICLMLEDPGQKALSGKLKLAAL
jgi:hypothetical protein